MDKYVKQIREAAKVVAKACGEAEVGIILGSGLGGFEEVLGERREIAYDKIPSFPVSTVAGHAGQFSVGMLHGKRVLVMSGRFHHYEGHSLQAVTMPVRVMQLLGVKQLIVTNAAGGVNTGFSAGDLMLITDYINLSGRNPLRGKNLDDFGPRFPDMTNALDKGLQQLALDEAQQQGLALRQGVYCWMNGPSYESPAEIRMARLLGADAVGMSTVPEIIVARHGGLQVLGLSTITNMAAGVLDQPIAHDEVLAVGQQVRASFRRLLDGIIARL